MDLCLGSGGVGIWELGRWLVVASEQPCPVAEAVFEVALEFQENGGVLSGGRGPAAFAHHAAGQASAGGAVQPPVMPFNPSSLGRPHVISPRSSASARHASNE